MKYFKKDNTVTMSEESLGSEWIEITETEYNRILSIIHEITTKQFELKRTDYKCLKYIDGALTEEEYAPIKAARAALRAEINELESQI